MNRTSDELLVLFDNAPLNRRFWITFILMSALAAFLFLAFCMALVGLSFLLLGVETHGKAMVLDRGAAR